MLYVCFFASLLPVEKKNHKKTFSTVLSGRDHLNISTHRPGVTQCGWQPFKIQLLTNFHAQTPCKRPSSTSMFWRERQKGKQEGGHKYVKNYSPVLLPSLNQHLPPGTTLLPRRSSSHNSNFPSLGTGCCLRLGRTPDLPLWHFALGLVRSWRDPTGHAWPLITVRITFLSILVSGGKMLVNMHFRCRVQQT